MVGEPPSPARPTPAERSLANALGAWREIARRLQGQRVALFLDYDGTLAAIAPSPELAVLTPAARSALEAVARAWPTAIVSGRALDDVEQRVGVGGLVYAGSHGFDICGPGELRLQVSANSVAVLREAASELRWLTRDVPGVLVEEKRFSVALHFRQAPRAALSRLQETFHSVSERHPGLRASTGKAILELRPAVDWGKGHAVRWLLQALGLTGPDVVPVYIGDDLTDEDGFRAVADSGLAVLVGGVSWSDHAQYALADVEEVRQMLLRLTALRPTGAARAPGAGRERAEHRPR